MKKKIIGFCVCAVLLITPLSGARIPNNILKQSITIPIPEQISSSNWIQMQKLLASDGYNNNDFGWSVSLYGNTILVGAPNDNNKGSVYVFIRSGATWIQQQKLFAIDGEVGDCFGESVSLDGDTALIGAYGDDGVKGSVYVFTRNNTIWTQQAKLLASDGAPGNQFGFYVSLDDDTALIGAVADDDLGYLSGSAYIFNRTGSTWGEQQKLLASDGTKDDRFGFTVSLQGNTALIGAIFGNGITIDSGAVYVFTCTNSVWTQQQKIYASDGESWDIFGHSVSLDGNTALIGARFDEAYAGSAYVFTFSGTTWKEQQKLLPSDSGVDDSFGISVSLDGNTALIGAMDEISHDDSGAAYVFTRTGTIWTQVAKLLPLDGAPGDWFGGRISLFDDTALIGAAWDDDNGDRSGSAYVFAKTGFSFNITGSLWVNLKITNNGVINATVVPWWMHVQGRRILGQVNKIVNGTIDIPAGGTKIIRTGILFFSGHITITIKVAGEEQIIQGFKIGPFLIVHY
jgi:hypothetical protein